MSFTNLFSFLCFPDGWKTKISGSRQFYISPDGHQFPNRRLALKHLIENKGSIKDVEKMRQSLRLDNWKQDDKLPADWRYKRDHDGGITYLTKAGKILHSSELISLPCL